MNWLPITENIDFNIYTYQALNDKKWPAYLNVETVKCQRNLGANGNSPKVQYAEPNTFQSQALIFNDLPKAIRQSTEKSQFATEARKFYKVIRQSTEKSHFATEARKFYKDKALTRAQAS